MDFLLSYENSLSMNLVNAQAYKQHTSTIIVLSNFKSFASLY